MNEEASKISQIFFFREKVIDFQTFPWEKQVVAKDFFFKFSILQKGNVQPQSKSKEVFRNFLWKPIPNSVIIGKDEDVYDILYWMRGFIW